MTPDARKFVQSLHDISKMIIVAADMHRQHTRLLIVLLEAGANVTDVILEMRANEEMFCGYLTRISSLADKIRLVLKDTPLVAIDDVPADDDGHTLGGVV